MNSKVIINKKLITSKVSTILKNYPDITVPVDIEGIAKSRGLEVIPYPLSDDVSGLLSIEGNKATIGYNIKEPSYRIRFTIAHELAHYELHRDRSHLFVDKQYIYRSVNSGDTLDKLVMEHEANAFASAILMPSDLLRKEILRTDLNLMDEKAIEKLADLFEVSNTAMSIRISGLGMF